jgi:hypothetical protein
VLQFANVDSAGVSHSAVGFKGSAFVPSSYVCSFPDRKQRQCHGARGNGAHLGVSGKSNVLLGAASEVAAIWR